MKKLLSGILLFIPILVFGQIQSVKPVGKYQTSFAIVVDRKTYDAVKPAIELYRDMLLKEGLGAYILIDDKNDAAVIRQTLKSMYKAAPKLEGCVLIGDVPVVMVRDAQHMSSAFKMDQNMKWERSSIPSDRFYDDFSLNFKFIKNDENDPLLHYYALDATSAMRLQSNIYSARIKAPERNGGRNKYELIDAYLRKVVAERNTINKVDNLMMFRGHGYNSEALEAWSGEQISLREQLPELFKAGSKAKFLAYESKFPYKFDLLSEVQREDLDIALFHEHGSDDLQYINAYPLANNPQQNIESIKYYVRGKIRTGLRRKNDLNELIDYYTKYLDIPRDWCLDNDSLAYADSITERNMDIYLDDIYNTKPNARFVMFDACYNGAFNNKEYIAAAYIFGEGKTIVALGNSVNSLQDKFPDELIGLLGQGVRIGLWAKHINYLETHLLGDPTFCFAPTDKDLNLNREIVLRESDSAYWLSLLNSKHADVQALALKKLCESNYKGIAGILKNTYFKSEFGAVRMECIRLLSTIDNEDFIAVLQASVDDPYELVRRLGMEYIGKNGSPDLKSSIIHSIIYDNTSRRVAFKANTAIGFYNPEVMKAELEEQINANTNYIQKDSLKDYVISIINSRSSMATDYLKEMKDNSLKEKARINAIRSIRNMNCHYLLPDYIALAEDESENLIIRETMLEALSWFYLSYRRDDIITLCDNILNSAQDDKLKYQALKTKNIILNKGVID